MKLFSFTALIVILGLMIGFSTNSYSTDKDAKSPAAKDTKSCCQKLSSTVSNADTPCPMHASNAKDCPFVNGKCVKGSCDKTAMKSGDMKDCCKNGDMKDCPMKGAMGTKTSGKTAKSNKTSTVVSVKN